VARVIGQKRPCNAAKSDGLPPTLAGLPPNLAVTRPSRVLVERKATLCAELSPTVIAMTKHAVVIAGVRFVDVGRLGHINVDADVRDWPEGHRVTASAAGSTRRFSILVGRIRRRPATSVIAF
jgi:hypothetical protein